MALTPDEKSYLDRLKAAGANKESMTELLEKRRAKEKAQKPGIIGQGIQTLQNIGGGAIQAGGELAVGLPGQISRLLPGDQSADQSSFYNKTQRLLESTKKDMTKQGIQTDSTGFGFGKGVMNLAGASVLSGGVGNLASKYMQLGLKAPTSLVGKTAVGAIKGAKEGLAFDLASGQAPGTATAGGAIIGGAIPGLSQAAGVVGRYMSKIPANPAINQSKVGAYTEGAIKEGLSTAKKMAKDIIAPYTSKIDETSGIMSAIKPKQIVKNGAVTRSQEQITKEIELANNMIRKAGLKPKSIAEYNTAIKTNMQKLGSEIESKTKQKLYVNLTDTATKLKNLANSPAIQRLDPAGAKELKNMAARMRIKQGFLKVEDAEMMNQIINDTLRNPATASETTKRGFQIIVGDLRDKLDDAISKIPGEFKELKKAYGALRNVYRDGISREIVYNRANPEGLISSYSKIEGGSDFMSGIMKMAGLDVKGGIADIAKGLTKNKLGQVIKTKNDPNYIINKIFNDTTTSVTNPMGSNSATVSSAISSKAKVKQSLPLSSKSEVKYSKPIGKELEPLKEFLTKQKNYDDKFAELSVKANEIAKEYPGIMGTISEEGRKIPANKKILEDLAYYKKLSQDFNSLESSKKFIKQLGKMSIMERKALRNSIK